MLFAFRSFITATLCPDGPISGIVLHSLVRKTSLKESDTSDLDERSRSVDDILNTSLSSVVSFATPPDYFLSDLIFLLTSSCVLVSIYIASEGDLQSCGSTPPA